MKEAWVYTLKLEFNFQIEERISVIMNYLSVKMNLDKKWLISDMDATGPLGAEYSNFLDSNDSLMVSQHDMEELFREQGQVIEFQADLIISAKQKLRLVILDGTSVDVLGQNLTIPLSVLGPCESQDINQYKWPE